MRDTPRTDAVIALIREPQADHAAWTFCRKLEINLAQEREAHRLNLGYTNKKLAQAQSHLSALVTALAERDARIASLQAKLAESEKDAGRYRWIASREAYLKIFAYPGFHKGATQTMWEVQSQVFPSLDAAIDALKEQP